MKQELPSASELAQQIGVSRNTAYKRLMKYQSGQCSLEAVFAPRWTGRGGQYKTDCGLTSHELTRRVPGGLSITSARKRLQEYRRGQCSFESLFAPRGGSVGEGNKEWRTLGTRQRWENMPKLGSWEEEVLQK